MALPALLLTVVAATSTVAVPVDPAPAVATWSVDDGTTGALVEDHRAPTVTIRIAFPVGTWSPWARAHHAEEAFEYQNDDPDQALKKRADALGIRLSLGMGDRRATLSTTCLTRDLDATLALIRDVLGNARYDERDLKRANRQRSIAWKATETNIEFQLASAAARAVFRDPEDPRRRRWEKPDKLETHAAKLAAARDALIRFPGRIVGLAGDVDPARAKAAAASLLPAPSAAAPAGLAPKLGPIVPAAERPREESIPMRNLTQVYFAYGRESLPWTDPRRPAFLIADQVLGGGFYSRLYVALRHKTGETYGATTREYGDVVPGVYGAATFTRAANAAATEATFRQTMRTFWKKGITEDEREAAADYLEGSRAFERQSADQILSRWMREKGLGLPAGFGDALVDRAAKLPLDAINAFIRDFYDPSRFSMIEAVPK